MDSQLPDFAAHFGVWSKVGVSVGNGQGGNPYRQKTNLSLMFRFWSHCSGAGAFLRFRLFVSARKICSILVNLQKLQAENEYCCQFQRYKKEKLRKRFGVCGVRHSIRKNHRKPPEKEMSSCDLQPPPCEESRSQLLSIRQMPHAKVDGMPQIPCCAPSNLPWAKSGFS